MVTHYPRDGYLSPPSSCYGNIYKPMVAITIELGTTMYDYVWLCMAMYDKACLNSLTLYD